MTQYETMYIVDADLTEEQLEPILEKYKKIVTSMGGEVLDAGKWEGGRRRLAYPIAGRREGIYILMNFDSGPDVPKELERVFKISDEVFRHLIVKREEGAPPIQSSYHAPAPATVAPAPAREPAASVEAAAPAPTSAVEAASPAPAPVSEAEAPALPPASEPQVVEAAATE